MSVIKLVLTPEAAAKLEHLELGGAYEVVDSMPVFHDHYAKRDPAAGVIVYANGGMTSVTFPNADIVSVEGEVE